MSVKCLLGELRVLGRSAGLENIMDAGVSWNDIVDRDSVQGGRQRIDTLGCGEVRLRFAVLRSMAW